MSPKTLEEQRTKLRQYIKAKEERSGDDISTRVGRDKTRGYVTSFFPIISIRRILSNYAEKKGILFKIMNPSTEYKSGRSVIFPKARNFFGATRKDSKLPKSQRGIISRLRNMSDAQYLTRIIDNIGKTKEQKGNLKFYEEVYQQILIKRASRSNDTYYRLLTEIFNDLDQENKNVITKKYDDLSNATIQDLKEKRDFLDWTAENTNSDNYVRGEDYSYDHLKKTLQNSNRTIDFERIKEGLSTSSNLQPVNEAEIKKPKEKFNSDDAITIELPKVAKLFDEAMHMRLEKNAEDFAAYVIKGKVENGSTTAIIGKDNQPLPNGWYQFVIMANTNSDTPEIRYYPCAEKQDGPALYQQIEKQKNLTTNPELLRKDSSGQNIPLGEGKYVVTSPEGHALKYEKFVAHSQLAGGKPVLSGGAFMVVDGKIKVIEDSSGHYAAEKDSKNEFGPIRIAHRAFNCFGILADNCAFERWEPYKGIDKVFKKTAGALKNPIAPPKTLQKNPELIAAIAENRAIQRGKATPAQTLLESDQRKSPFLSLNRKNKELTQKIEKRSEGKENKNKTKKKLK